MALFALTVRQVCAAAAKIVKPHLRLYPRVRLKEDPMSKWSPKIRPGFIWKDFLASIVVFLTALPLCMGISLASGAPVEAGLISGIVGGIIVGFLSGSSFQVSGPAAGLSVLVFEFIQAHGFASLGIVMIVAGVIQIAAGLLRTGQLFRAVSPAVVHGMLSGIGLLIVFGQLFVMVGSRPKGSGLQNIIALPELVDSICRPGTPHFYAAIIGCTTIVVMIVWKLVPKRLQVIPAALVSVLVASILAAIIKAPINYVSLPGNIFSAIQLPNWSAISHLGTWEIIENGFALALIASAETLLSANAVDRLHNGKRTRYDRELLAQGIGNTICAFIGGLPMTGVIARSSVNVHAGAKTRLSAIFHGIWLFIFVSLWPQILKSVPIAALAALLVYTGFKLIDIAEIRKLCSYGWRIAAIYVATLVSIVCTDLLTGVMVGIGLSLLKLFYTMSRLYIVVEHEPDSNRVWLRLQGAATFVSLPKLTGVLEGIPGNSELHICLERVDYVDHACLELFLDWEKQHLSSGGSLSIDWGELAAAFRHKARRRGGRLRNICACAIGKHCDRHTVQQSVTVGAQIAQAQP